MEPPSSEPIETGPTPAATLAPEPPLDPPEDRSSAGSHGVRHSRVSRFTVRGLLLNSGVLLLAKTIAPAARSRATNTASWGGTKSSKSFDP